MILGVEMDLQDQVDWPDLMFWRMRTRLDLFPAHVENGDSRKSN